MPRPGLTLSPRYATQITVMGASSGFINIGERCNISGSRKFKRLIKQNKYLEAVRKGTVTHSNAQANANANARSVAQLT